ncbi:MAG: pilus assembly protein PilM [Thiohalorhabdus sp.]
MPIFKKKRPCEGLSVAVDVRRDALILVTLRGGAPAPLAASLARIPLEGPGRPAPQRLTELLAPEVERRGLQGCSSTSLLYRPQFNLVLTEAPDGVAEEDLPAAMRWRVRDLIDFPAEEAVVDVLPIPVPPLPGEGDPLLVVAAPRETVRARVTAFLEAGLDLQVVDIPDMAHRNLVRLLPDEGSSGVCLVVLSPEDPLITISRHGELVFSRQLGVNVREELGALAVEGGEAPETSGVEGLALEDEPAGGEEAFQRAGTGYAERLALEIQRSLDYYDSRFRQGGVQRIHLAGEGALVEGLMEELEEVLGRDFRFLDPRDFLTISTESEAEVGDLRVQEAIYALGAGLRMVDAEGPDAPDQPQ